MITYAEGIAESRSEERAEAPPLAFTTAFRSGTGGHRVAVFPDRIVTHRRDGRTSVLPIGDIVSASTFEDGASEPAYGVHFVVQSPPRDIAYRFDDADTRRAFLRAVLQAPTRAPGT
jgi:hypothetical protein